MKNSLLLTLAVTSQLAGGVAFAQNSGRNVTILRMSGPQLGVRLEEVDKDVVSRLKLKEEKGALVVEVLEKSAAEKAGIHKDDVIVRFQGESVLTAAQLSRIVRDVPEGRRVDIDLIRAGAPLKVTATLEKAEWSDRPDMPDVAELRDRLTSRMEGMPRNFDFKFNGNGQGPMVFMREGRGRLGITYTEIGDQLAAYFKAPKDSAILVNSVVEGSAADKAGIKAGDLLIKLGGASIENGDDLQDAVRDIEPGKPASLTVLRDGRSIDLSVTISEERRRNDTARFRHPVS